MRDYIYLLATDQKNGFIDSIFKAFLWLLSCIYSLIVRLRNAFYDWGIFKIAKVDRPVVSVGNLTMGGVGKTPIVLMLTEWIQSSKHRPAIVMRGYMPSRSTQSDEANVIKNRSTVPIVLGADRYQAIQKFLSDADADIFIMDDGFQHRHLHRDLNIVAIDALNPWGNTHLIPRGILRESLLALTRADCVILTKSNLVAPVEIQKIKETIAQVNNNLTIVLAEHAPECFVDLRTQESMPLAQIEAKNILLVSSIGRPESFEMTVKNLGVSVTNHKIFKDHYEYTANDLHNLQDLCSKNSKTTLITTEKDAVKIKPLLNSQFKDIHIYFLKINLEITQGQDSLRERILNLL